MYEMSRKKDLWLQGWEPGVTAHGWEGSFWGDKGVVKLDCGDGSTTLNLLKKKNHKIETHT